MGSNDIHALQNVIRKLHGCGSEFVETVQVKDDYQGSTIWEGEVSVFKLRGHSGALRCYAWSRAADDGEQSLVVALHERSLDSPLAAVRAAIAAQFRG